MNDLQLFAKCYVEAHDLDSKSKKELFEFIDIGSDAEVINLIETGNMEYLTPLEEKQILESSPPPNGGNGGIVQAFLSLSKAVGQKMSGSVDQFHHWIQTADFQTVKQMATKLVKDATTTTNGILTTTLVTIFIFLAAKYLKERLSQANKACKGKKGKDFQDCVTKYKLDTYKGQIAILQQGLKDCRKTKNPQKCTKKLQDKITKIKQKMAKLSKDIQKYK